MCRTRSWVQILSSHNVSVIMTVSSSVRLIGSEADLALALSIANVSRKHGMSGKSLCKGSEILELVRASHRWSSSAKVDGPVDCDASMVTSCISVCIRSTLLLLAVSIHSLAACQTSSCTCHWVAWVLQRVVTC